MKKISKRELEKKSINVLIKCVIFVEYLIIFTMGAWFARFLNGTSVLPDLFIMLVCLLIVQGMKDFSKDMYDKI